MDSRNDIFSFGAVLYEMITGRRAFSGDSMVSILSAVLRDDPKPAGENVRDLPREGAPARVASRGGPGRGLIVDDQEQVRECTYQLHEARMRGSFRRPRNPHRLSVKDLSSNRETCVRGHQRPLKIRKFR